MVIALAGRRIDASDAEQPCFPIRNLGRVKEDIRVLFKELNPEAVVCSAANGTDLLALEVTEELAIDRIVVLPFAPQVFRNTSVVDRPGKWGEAFDQLIASVTTRGTLLCLDVPDRGPSAYRAANAKIIEQAQSLARQLHTNVTAVVVWNGRSRGADDITSEFRRAALEAGLQIKEVSTLAVNPTKSMSG